MTYTVGHTSSNHRNNWELLVTLECLKASIPKLSATNLDNVFQVMC